MNRKPAFGYTAYVVSDSVGVPDRLGRCPHRTRSRQERQRLPTRYRPPNPPAITANPVPKLGQPPTGVYAVPSGPPHDLYLPSQAVHGPVAAVRPPQTRRTTQTRHSSSPAAYITSPRCGIRLEGSNADGVHAVRCCGFINWAHDKDISPS